jgi:hypothetical protein
MMKTHPCGLAMSVTHTSAGMSETTGDFGKSHHVQGRLVLSQYAQFVVVVTKTNVQIEATGVKKESDPAHHPTDTVTIASEIEIESVIEIENGTGNATKRERKTGSVIETVIGKIGKRIVILGIAKKKKKLAATSVIKIGSATERNDRIVEIVIEMIGAMKKIEIKIKNAKSSRPAMQSQMMASSAGKSFLLSPP